jgi:hypothetical protein
MIEVRPLSETTTNAIRLLYSELGVVNTVRFLSQFTVGYGDYTEERDLLLKDKSLDQIVQEINQGRNRRPSKD